MQDRRAVSLTNGIGDIDADIRGSVASRSRCGPRALARGGAKRRCRLPRGGTRASYRTKPLSERPTGPARGRDGT